MHLPTDGPSPTGLPLDGYIRVSRVGDRRGDSYISPEVQTRAITRKAAEMNQPLVLHEPEENVSGGTMNRPIFNTIMDRIRAGQSGGIVVYKLDRFARNLIGGYQTLTEIASLGAVFASASEPHFDFSTPSGRMILQQHLMFAEYWREISKEEWRGAVSHAVDRGVYTAPYGAYGYDRGPRGRLVLVEDESSWVAEAYRLRVEERMAFPAIAELLNQHAPRRRDGRPWTGPSVQRMIGRRVYRGESYYGRDQNTTGRAPIVNVEAHEPIVSEQLWRAAQQPIHAFSKKRQTDPALLQGLVRCAGCRYLASCGKAGGLYQYRCRAHHVSGECPAVASVTSSRLEDYVEDLVAAELHRRRGAFVASADSRELDQANIELRAAQAALTEMREDATARQRLGARWLDFVEPYLRAEEEASARVDELTRRMTSTMRGMTSTAYRGLDKEARKTVLGQMIDAVMIRRPPADAPRGRHTPPLDDSRVLVLWRGQGPQNFPVKSRFASEGITSFEWPEHEGEAIMMAA